MVAMSIENYKLLLIMLILCDTKWMFAISKVNQSWFCLTMCTDTQTHIDTWMPPILMSPIFDFTEGQGTTSTR